MKKHTKVLLRIGRLKETSFRAASDLSPKRGRIDAHLSITVLSFHIAQAIRYRLKQHGISCSWAGIRCIFASYSRVTTQVEGEHLPFKIHHTTHSSPAGNLQGAGSFAHASNKVLSTR